MLNLWLTSMLFLSHCGDTVGALFVGIWWWEWAVVGTLLPHPAMMSFMSSYIGGAQIDIAAGQAQLESFKNAHSPHHDIHDILPHPHHNDTTHFLRATPPPHSLPAIPPGSSIRAGHGKVTLSGGHPCNHSCDRPAGKALLLPNSSLKLISYNAHWRLGIPTNHASTLPPGIRPSIIYVHNEPVPFVANITDLFFMQWFADMTPLK